MQSACNHLLSRLYCGDDGNSGGGHGGNKTSSTQVNDFTKLLNSHYPMLRIGMNAQVIKLHLLREKKAGGLGLSQLVSIHKVQ